MLDNPDKSGIYPTGQAYYELDQLFCKILDSFIKSNSKIIEDCKIDYLNMKELING